MYEDLTAEDAMRLACKHLNRNQEIPKELMAVLEGLGFADTFRGIDEDNTDSA